MHMLLCSRSFTIKPHLGLSPLLFIIVIIIIIYYSASLTPPMFFSSLQVYGHGVGWHNKIGIFFPFASLSFFYHHHHHHMIMKNGLGLLGIK